MEGEALNTTERARDESAAEFPEPKRLREADAIIEILDSNDEDDSAVELIEISDDDEEDISAWFLDAFEKRHRWRNRRRCHLRWTAEK